jgi:hypothetical protein
VLPPKASDTVASADATTTAAPSKRFFIELLS